VNYRERIRERSESEREREREREREEGRGGTERVPLFENNARYIADRCIRSVNDPRWFVNVRASSTVAELCNFQLARMHIYIYIYTC